MSVSNNLFWLSCKSQILLGECHHQCLCVVSTVSIVTPSFSACFSRVSGSAGSIAAALPDLLASLLQKQQPQNRQGFANHVE